MDKAFIQHAEHDIHRHDRRHHQPDGVAERRLEGEGAALELGADIGRQIQRLFGGEDGVDRIAQRVVIRDVERNGGHRELIEMVNRQRREALLDAGDGLQRHDAAPAAGQANIVQRRQPRRLPGVMLQHHAILVGLSVDGRDQPLAEGVIQRIIDIGHADAETAGAVAIDFDIGGEALILPVAADVGELRKRLETRQQLRHPVTEGIQRVRLQGELILGPADGGIDSQILGRL
ncbi:Uncharacterised protein [Raoultella ornithinolytica]|nr:Uncharacterised protein [Raoultella ornithinolytica]